MLSSGPGVGGRDDLGARLLAEHPRGEEWRQLDVTVANPTLDQLIRMGGLVEPGDQRAAARAQLIEGIGEGELANRLGSRWVRWADTFGLPQPANVRRRIVEVLGHPYMLTDTDELPAAYLAGILAVFDAGLGIAAAPAGDPGTSANQLLTCPWRRTCLPSRFTPSTAYGPHTQSALALLREARTLAPAVVTRIRRRRAALESVEWATARRDVEDSALPGVIPSGRKACSGKLSRPPRMLRASHPPIPTWLRACGAPRPRRPSPGAWDPIPANC
ncbi:MAG TPA: hypothetical protein VFW64_05475 [Pseudonocardiaceae bacterium]|nr:hypothetical protein [Pseudonocardiaceae bacterium]